MREIGIVSRFAPPTKKGQGNVFAYIERIERKSRPEIRVYQRQLRCSIDDFLLGMLVVFEAGRNPEDNLEEAQDVRLITQIGEVTYFGVGLDENEIDYGVAKLIDSEKCQLFQRIDKKGIPEVFLHTKNCLSSPKKLYQTKTYDPEQRKLIVFEIRKNKLKNRDDAIKIRLLNDLHLSPETEKNILTKCFELTDIRVEQFIFDIVNKLVAKLSEEESLENEDIILQIAQILQETSLQKRPSIIFLLPEWSWLKRHQAIFKLLSPVEQVNTLVEQLSEEESTENEYIILRIARILQETSLQKRPSTISQLPEWSWLKRHQAIFKLLSPVEQVDTLVEQLSEKESVENEDIILRIARILQETSLQKRSSIISQLPGGSCLKRYEAIFKLLSPVAQVKTLAAQLSEEEPRENEDTILRIARILEESYQENRSLVYRVQEHQSWKWLKRHEAIFPFLESKDKVGVLASRINESNQLANEFIILQIAQIIEESSPENRPSLIDQLPNLVKREPAIFQLLTLNEQIELAYCYLENSDSLFWQQLSPKAKILCIYRITKESINLANILSTLQRLQREKPENDLRVRCVLNLIRAKVHPLKRDEVFENVDSLLIQYVVEQAQNSAESLTLEPLLPHCRPQKVKYCEGRPWLTEEDKQSEASKASRAFCPRTKCSCSLFNPNESENFGSNLEGARLYPECSQHWKDWSLLELLEAVGIMGILPESQTHNDYVQKLSGWVNRINEIRERLKCSVCRQMMPHNIEYAKFLAKFRVTVFSCPQGHGHDQNIYLNECWACGEIIDSRESKYFAKEDGYHICIHCGSGTKGSNIYTQGDSCPNCDTPAMAVSQYRRRQCCSCKHSIRLPDERKMTGPKCPKCNTRGMMLILSQKNEQIRVCRSQSCGYSIKLSAQQHLYPSQQWEDEMSF